MQLLIVTPWWIVNILCYACAHQRKGAARKAALRAFQQDGRSMQLCQVRHSRSRPCNHQGGPGKGVCSTAITTGGFSAGWVLLEHLRVKRVKILFEYGSPDYISLLWRQCNAQFFSCDFYFPVKIRHLRNLKLGDVFVIQCRWPPMKPLAIVWCK